MNRTLVTRWVGGSCPQSRPCPSQLQPQQPSRSPATAATTKGCCHNKPPAHRYLQLSCDETLEDGSALSVPTRPAAFPLPPLPRLWVERRGRGAGGRCNPGCLSTSVWLSCCEGWHQRASCWSCGACRGCARGCAQAWVGQGRGDRGRGWVHAARVHNATLCTTNPWQCCSVAQPSCNAHLGVRERERARGSGEGEFSNHFQPAHASSQARQVRPWRRRLVQLCAKPLIIARSARPPPLPCPLVASIPRRMQRHAQAHPPKVLKSVRSAQSTFQERPSILKPSILFQARLASSALLSRRGVGRHGSGHEGSGGERRASKVVYSRGGTCHACHCAARDQAQLVAWLAGDAGKGGGGAGGGVHM